MTAFSFVFANSANDYPFNAAVHVHTANGRLPVEFLESRFMAFTRDTTDAVASCFHVCMAPRI